MKKNRIPRWLKFAAMGVGAVVVFTFIIMTLWNWLLPSIVGVSAITFWQAFGLLVLAKILFGGFRRRGHWMWRKRMHARWSHMTEEEREKFRHGMHGCGWHRRPAEQPVETS